jgi:hypothetical protein
MSSNVTVQRLGDASQLDNDPHRLDYIRQDQKAPIYRNRTSGNDIHSYGMVGLLFFGLLATVLWLLKVATCWGATTYATPLACTVLSVASLSWTVGVPLLVLVSWCVLLYGKLQKDRSEALSNRIVRDRYSNPVDALMVASPDWNAAAYFASAQQAEERMAPFKQLPAGLDSLSLSSGGGKAAAGAEDAEATAPLIPAEEWLMWLDEKPHLLLAAETGGGKSVLASVVVARRAEQRGDAIAVLDPHWSPQVEADEGQLVPKWGGIAPAARSHAEIRQALRVLRAEYDQRMQQLRTGAIVERHFPPLTVVIDEVPEVVAEIKRLDRRGEDAWADTTEVLGSGARKVNISIILLTQSPLVQDIALNSAMRRNFARVALQHAEIVSLLREASDAENKAAVLAAVRGQRYPAALLRDGEAYALDRRDLLARMPRAIAATPWTPPQQPMPQAVPDEKKQAVLAALRRARAKGWTREQARVAFAQSGIQFENALWTKAGEE